MTRRSVLVVACAMGVVACRPSDVLSVPPPAGVTSSAGYNSQSGAEALANNGKGQLFQAFAGGFASLLQWSGLLGDEFRLVFFTDLAADANVDARVTAARGGFAEPGDQPLQTLLGARVTLLRAVPVLQRYEPPSGRAKIGEAYALVGYAELLIAEDYCAGVPLGALIPGVGVEYGTPLTTDSLLAVAEADFDSAAAYSEGDAGIAGLAGVGVARALLDRGQFAAAASAAHGVPTGFVYNSELAPGPFNTAGNNMYDYETVAFGCGVVNVADHKGGNGLDYLSAHDPRIVVDSSIVETCDGAFGGPDSVLYYPTKFGNPSAFVPLATGVEARLVEAESALHAGNTGAWAAILNALRSDSMETHVTFAALLLPDSTTGASRPMQVDVMFRERAFWMYGTGARLGDMRRMIRQYGRMPGAVFPVGPYPNASNAALPSPLPAFGADVDLTLPTPASGVTDPNPAYKGCTTSTTTA